MSTPASREQAPVPEQAPAQAPPPRAPPASAPVAGRSLLAAGSQAVRRLADDEREADRHAASAPPLVVPPGVRLRTDARAGRVAEALHARAVTHGDEVLFAPGAYVPGTAEGRRLLAHELAHVAQQRAAGRRAVRRSPRREVLRSSVTPRWAEGLSDEDLRDTIQLLRTHLTEAGATAPDADALRTNLSTLETEQLGRGAPRAPSPATGTASFDERLAAFKRRVLAVAVQRMHANRQNLGLWAAVVEHDLSSRQLGFMALAQSGGMRAYEELQTERNPMVRELRAHQAFGRYRACTGCHLEVQARARAHDDPQFGPAWLSPRERRLGLATVPSSDRSLIDAWSRTSGTTLLPERRREPDVAALMAWINRAPGPSAGSGPPGSPAPAAARGGYRPPSGTAEARLHALYPDPQQTRQGIDRLRPVIQQLGPEGYKVLPGGMITRLERGEVAAVRADIVQRIHQRRADYLQLARKIEAGELDYGHFLPIIRDLLPTAQPDVQAAVRQEMADEAFWAKVEAVVVGIVSIAVLLLTIFPPTTALGVGALATMEIGLGVHGVVRGSQRMHTGSLYALGVGAHDVLTPQQQAAGDAMVLGGFVEVALGALSFVGGWSRMGTVGQARPGTALATTRGTGGRAPGGGPAAALPPGATGRTIQRGPYLLTIEADGSMIVTVTGRPDLMMIVRDGTATLYQTLGRGGGVRVIGTAPVPVRGPLALPPPGAPSTALTVPGAGAPGGAAAPGGLLGPTGAPLLRGPPAPLALPAPAPTPLLAGPRPVPLLQAAPHMTRTLQQVRNLRGPERWQAAETWAQEAYGATGQRHYPVPPRGGPEPITGTGGRHVDVPVDLPGGRVLAGEVKMYGRWRTVEGVPQQQAVPLSDTIRQQILKDAWLRDNVAGFDPRWLFLDAPPSPELAAFLRQNNIAYVIYH